MNEECERMHIVVSPDSFKGTMSSLEAGQTIKDALIDRMGRGHRIDILSVSDGGEGLVEVFKQKKDSKLIEVNVLNPVGRLITASYLRSGDTAVIESAAACGLTLLSENERNPLYTSSYGLGQMIEHATMHGAKECLIGLGGTSTNDMGTGMLEALGIRFYDEKHKELVFMNGEKLGEVSYINDDAFILKDKDISFRVACDVTNPLLGEHGATYTYGPQKGATAEICHLLETNMMHIVEQVKLQKPQMAIQSKMHVEGTGAAGGLGLALYGFVDAKLEPGIEIILDQIDFDNYIRDCDMIITGEGRMDGQTLHGKVPFGILSRAQKYNVSVIAVCGSVNTSQNLLASGFNRIYSVVPTVATLDESISAPKEMLYKLIKDICVPGIADEVNDVISDEI